MGKLLRGFKTSFSGRWTETHPRCRRLRSLSPRQSVAAGVSACTLWLERRAWGRLPLLCAGGPGTPVPCVPGVAVGPKSWQPRWEHGRHGASSGDPRPFSPQKSHCASVAWMWLSATAENGGRGNKRSPKSAISLGRDAGGNGTAGLALSVGFSNYFYGAALFCPGRLWAPGPKRRRAGHPAPRAGR